MEMKIDDNQLAQILQTAVLKLLEPPERERIIREAIQRLMTEPVEDRFFGSDKKRPMFELMFEQSLHFALRDKFDKYWESEEGGKKIDELVAKALGALVDDVKVREAMAQGLENRLGRGY